MRKDGYLIEMTTKSAQRTSETTPRTFVRSRGAALARGSTRGGRRAGRSRCRRTRRRGPRASVSGGFLNGDGNATPASAPMMARFRRIRFSPGCCHPAMPATRTRPAPAEYEGHRELPGKVVLARFRKRDPNLWPTLLPEPDVSDMRVTGGHHAARGEVTAARILPGSRRRGQIGSSGARPATLWPGERRRRLSRGAPHASGCGNHVIQGQDGPNARVDAAEARFSQEFAPSVGHSGSRSEAAALARLAK